MPCAHHVLLVPGFFGFAQLGEFAYFAHVRDFLVEALPEVGVRGEVEVVKTIPTGSLDRRAALLAQSAAKLLEAKGGGSLSLIGHSSGGLDARLFASPGTKLPTSVDVEPIASTVRAIVTVATPHFGTPLAPLFNSLFGEQLLNAEERRECAWSAAHPRSGQLRNGVDVAPQVVPRHGPARPRAIVWGRRSR